MQRALEETTALQATIAHCRAANYWGGDMLSIQSYKRVLLVSASAVEALVGSLGYSAAAVLFAEAFGVLVDGVLMTVESATESEIGGAPYVYRLMLRAPVAAAV